MTIRLWTLLAALLASPALAGDTSVTGTSAEAPLKPLRSCDLARQRVRDMPTPAATETTQIPLTLDDAHRHSREPEQARRPLPSEAPRQPVNIYYSTGADSACVDGRC